MLHVAPELCYIKRFEALPKLEYLTADIESPLAKIKMDIHDISFPENTFDIIFCNTTQGIFLFTKVSIFCVDLLR